MWEYMHVGFMTLLAIYAVYQVVKIRRNKK